MIIDKINVESIPILKAINDPPIAGNLHTKKPFPVAPKWVEIITRQIKLRGESRHIETAQNILYTIDMIRTNMSAFAVFIVRYSLFQIRIQEY